MKYKNIQVPASLNALSKNGLQPIIYLIQNRSRQRTKTYKTDFYTYKDLHCFLYPYLSLLQLFWDIFTIRTR